MKKLIFKVGSSKDSSIVSLIKEINKISCKIFVDLENGKITVEKVNNEMLETVIGLVDGYFTILNVDIDNTFEEETEENATEKATVLKPQSMDDLIIKKVEFENEYVEERINTLLRTAYWALYTRHANEKDVGDYIYTCVSEISMRYSNKPVIEFDIGDIVDVNFGSGLPGEIYRNHVHAVVCDIRDEGLAYIVPITKNKTDLTSKSFISFDAPQDAIYYNEYFTGGTALADNARCLRTERFNCVVGKTRTDFFNKLLEMVPSAFDFTEHIEE